MTGLYGSKKFVKLQSKTLKKALKEIGVKGLRIDTTILSRISRLNKLLPIANPILQSTQIEGVTRLLEYLSGQPFEYSLFSAYWRNSITPKAKSQINPAHDRCGVIWANSFFPVNFICNELLEKAKEICHSKNLEFMPNIVLVNSRTKLFLVELCFDRDILLSLIHI